MRPVRFVALSEDGHAFVLADEVGRLLALPIDDRVHVALHTDRGAQVLPGLVTEAPPSLAPRDIQARIRSGESADDVARIAGVPVDRVLRYAGPVLQERAMLAQHARRTKLRGSDKGSSLADVVDARLSQHGIDSEKISWDAYRREDGTWRVVASWPSGKATAQAVWELDKSRQVVTPHDDMAQYLCAERPPQILGQEPPTARGAGRGEQSRGGHEPMRPAADTARRESRPGRGLADPIRAGRDALLASLDRPLGTSTPAGRGLAAPAASADTGRVTRPGGAAALLGTPPPPPAFEEQITHGPAKDVPAVPSLAVLRPRRTGAPAPVAEQQPAGEAPRKRLPSWDDVLFGGAPAGRETS